MRPMTSLPPSFSQQGITQPGKEEMGKPGKLKSSVKALQEAITCFNPVTPTHSFRDLNSSFNSIYCNPSTDLSSPHKAKTQQTLSASDEEEPISRTSSSSSSSSSSSLTALSISTSRFFFSPCTTKSIMEEAKIEMGHGKMEPKGDPGSERGKTGDLVKMVEDCFCKESVPIAMASADPYRDFRISMEEMVEAYDLRELSSLQELLDCYLKLNEKKTHKFIVLAFVDLFIHINSHDRRSLSSNPSTHIHPCSSD